MSDGRLTRRNDAPGAAATVEALADLGRTCGGGEGGIGEGLNGQTGRGGGDVYDVDAVALAVAMAQPFKPMVLSGATTTEQLRSNAGALRLLRRLNMTRESKVANEDERGEGDEGGEGGDAADDAGQALARLLQVGRVDPGEYWSERSSLVWN